MIAEQKLEIVDGGVKEKIKLSCSCAVGVFAEAVAAPKGDMNLTADQWFYLAGLMIRYHDEIGHRVSVEAWLHSQATFLKMSVAMSRVTDERVW